MEEPKSPELKVGKDEIDVFFDILFDIAYPIVKKEQKIYKLVPQNKKKAS